MNIKVLLDIPVNTFKLWNNQTHVCNLETCSSPSTCSALFLGRREGIKSPLKECKEKIEVNSKKECLV